MICQASGEGNHPPDSPKRLQGALSVYKFQLQQPQQKVPLSKKATEHPGSLWLQSRAVRLAGTPRVTSSSQRQLQHRHDDALCQSGESWLKSAGAHPEHSDARVREASCLMTVNTIPEAVGSREGEKTLSIHAALTLERPEQGRDPLQAAPPNRFSSGLWQSNYYVSIATVHWGVMQKGVWILLWHMLTYV